MIGNRIGPYQLMELLGEGGMGEVYLAEQHEPVRRFVALKIIKLGMDSKQVVGRFETERQTLAMMEHPNIAKVLDAGLSPEGRPFFVMEYVKGVPVTEYCDRHRLPTEKRLELFLTICEAVQHAHQKGIIHRDLKPNNVLVSVIDNRPVPQVIDFGVARATARELTTHSLFTEHGQLVGTPEYMSPEQAEMTSQDIDTRTDIYSLGVLLYELIVGALPFDSRSLRSAGLAEIQRILREVDPPRPSTRLSTMDGSETTELARDRATALPQLRRQLRGDLDWITMRAMEKDRTRRYSSASEFAADIQRHLRDEPVLASPPTWRYRTGKFVRRHRVGVVAGSLVVLALLAGIAGTSWQAVRATKAEEQARRSEENANAVNDFLLETLRQNDPRVNPDGRDMLVSEALDHANQSIEGAYEGQPHIEAAVRYTLGITYREHSRLQDSERHLRRSLELRRSLPVEPGTLMNTRHALGLTLGEMGRLEESRALFQENLDDMDHGGASSPAHRLYAYHGLAKVAYRANEYALADSLYSMALGVEGPDGEVDHETRLTVQADHATLLSAAGRWEEAVVIYEQILAELEESQEGDHPWQAVLLAHLGSAHKEMGELEEAERLQRAAVDMNVRIYGKGHPQLAESVSELGRLLVQRGKYEEAESTIRQGIELHIAARGRDHEFTARAINNLGTLQQARGELDAALESYREVRDIEIRLYGEDPSRLATVNNNMAAVYREKEDFDRALASFREARAGFVSVYGEDHVRVGIVDNNIARTYMDAGRYEEAEASYRRALTKFQAAVPENHPNLAVLRGNLGENLRLAGRYEEAEPLLLQAYEILETKLGASHVRSIFVANSLAQLYDQIGRDEEAARWQKRASG